MKVNPYSDAIYSGPQAIEAVWILLCTGMIFVMQSGFAMLECGSIRAKNAKSILIKNMFDTVIGMIGFWLIGYGIAYGNPKEFIGLDGNYFASSGFERLEEDNYLKWVI